MLKSFKKILERLQTVGKKYGVCWGYITCLMQLGWIRDKIWISSRRKLIQWKTSDQKYQNIYVSQVAARS